MKPNLLDTQEYKDRPEDSGFIGRFFYPDKPSETETGLIIKASDELWERLNSHTSLHFRGGLFGMGSVLMQVTMIKIDDFVTISIPYNAYDTDKAPDPDTGFLGGFETIIYALQLASQSTIDISFYNRLGECKTFVKRNPIQRVFAELISIITSFPPWDQDQWDQACNKVKELYGADLGGLWDRCDLSKPENHSGDYHPTTKSKPYNPPSPASFSVN